MALLRPGDLVLLPSPGYPPYRTGTMFAGGECFHYPLVEEQGFLPDLESLPSEILKRARLMWLNYPNSPTGRSAPDSFLERVVEFGRAHDIILASDEAYSELYYHTPPRSLLEFGREGIVVFQSLSKRSAMTGYRVGWVCGDERLVSLHKRLKTNIDSGAPDFVQHAAVAALRDEDHVKQARRAYGEKVACLSDALSGAGMPASTPEATIYLWQRVPSGMSDVDFAMRLLEPAVGCAVMPGSWLSQPLESGFNPGGKYVRWALCPSADDVREAARRLGAAQ